MKKSVPEKKMSFLPEDYVERQIERRTSLVCLAMFAVVLLGVGGVYVFKWNQLSTARANQSKVNGEYAEAARRLDQLDALKKQQDEMKDKAELTAALLERVPRTYLLAELINRMPASLSLLELSLNTKTVKAAPPAAAKSALSNAKAAPGKEAANEKTKAKPREAPPEKTVTVALVGVAPTDVQVAQYMAALGQSPILKDVGLVYSEEAKIEEVGMRKFRIELVLAPTADVRSLDPVDRKSQRPRDPTDKPVVAPGVGGAAGDVIPGAVKGPGGGD